MDLSALLMKLLITVLKSVTTLNYKSFVVILYAILISVSVKGQEPVRVLWPLDNDAEAIYTSGIASATFSYGPGLHSFKYDSINGATAGGWNSRDLDKTDYFEYKIVPERDAEITFNTLDFEVSLNTVNMRVAVHYSYDEFKTQSLPIGHGIFVGKKSSRDLRVDTELTVKYPQTLSIRIYGWSAPTTVNFFTRNVEFNGVTVNPNENITLERDSLVYNTDNYRELLSTNTYNTSGTWNKPTGVISIYVEAWGGGGGASNTGNANSGGGGGAYAANLVTVPAATYSYTVGLGGAAGSNGGNTFFSTGTDVLAEGGKAGQSNGNGGSGGLVNNSIGLVRYSGGTGGNREGQNTAGGGGGGSATKSASGGNGTNGFNGIGGAGGTGQGNGGNGGNTSMQGLSGFTPGGGGGGNGDGSSIPGSGAAGQLTITYCNIFSINLQGSACSDSFTFITLSGSESGVNYQLLFNGSPIGSSIPGDGEAIPFGSYNAVGTYTIIATHSTNGCQSMMSGSLTINQSPEVSVGSITAVCQGFTSTSLPYTVSIGAPNWYTLDWDAAAEAQGFVDVPMTTVLPVSPIPISVPSGAASGTYNGTFKVRNSLTGCEGTIHNISVTVNPNPTITLGPNPSVCRGTTTASLSFSSTTASPDQYSIFWSEAAIGQGFSNVTNAILNASPINIAVPAVANPATYQATLQVKNSTTGCVSNLYNISVTINVVPTITLGTFPVICQGTTTANLPYTSTTGSPNRYSITWSAAAIAQGFTNVTLAALTASPIVINVPATATPDDYSGVLTVAVGSTGCTSIEYPFNLSIKALPIPTITGPDPVCQNVAGYIYSTETGNTNYQWQIVGGTINSASNTNTVSVTWTTPGIGKISVRYANSNNCYPLDWTTKDVTVNPAIAIPSITATPSTICNGGSSLLQAGTPTGGNGSFTYQWQSSPNGTSGWIDISGATGLTYTTGVLTTTTWYRLVISSGPCGPEYTSAISVWVQPVINPGTIEANQTICYNTQPGNLTSSNPGGNASACGTLTYFWEYSIDNGSTWTPTSQTSAQYVFTGPLSQTTQFRRFAGYVCNGVTCYSASSSNIVTITVQGELSPGSIASDQTICEGDTPAILTGTQVTNPPSIVTYQWQSSTDGTVFTNIAGATNQNYSPGALLADTWYRRNAISTIGTVNCNATSNVIRITVNNLNPGAISSSQTYCIGGLPVPFTSTSNASGDGIITYQWQSSTVSAITGFADIPGATSITYAPSASNAWYRRIATSTLNGITCSKISNVLEIRIVDFDPMTIAPSSGSFCGSGDPPLIIGQAVTINPPTTFTGYQWEYSIDNITWIPIAGAVSKDYNPPAISVTTYFRRATISSTYGISCTEYSNTSIWTVYADPSLTVTSPIEVCEGDIISIIASANNVTTGATYTLEYVSGSFIAPTQTNTSGVFTLDPNILPQYPVGQQIYKVTVTNTGPFVCTDEAFITIEIYDEPNITLTASCATGTPSVGFITMTGNVTYPLNSWVEYSKDGGLTWQVSPIFSNLPIGTYTILAKNGLKPSCISSLTGTIADQSVITYTYNICQGEPVPSGGGLIAGSLCITWGNATNEAKRKCTNDDGTDTYKRSNSMVAPYTQGPDVQYIRYLTFRAPNGEIHFKDCNMPANSGSFSLYEYPFVPQQPSFNFLRWTGNLANPCNLTTWTGLDPNKTYVLVLNSISSSSHVCANIELNKGDKLEAATGITDVQWYLDPEGNTQVGSGSPWNPVGGGNTGISNTECAGLFTFYAGCGDAECYQPANFIINPHATVVAIDKQSCSGSPVNVPLSATQTCNGVTTPVPAGIPITYSWTASLVSGNATGFTNCTDCGSLITDVITSTNNSTCPVIRYDITAKSGNCTGPVTSILVTVINNTSMTPPLAPDDITYSCITDVPAPPVISTNHACLGTLSATGVDTYNNGTGCSNNPLIITRTWTFQDACVQIIIDQIITVIDNVAPTFTVPVDFTVYVDEYCQYSISPEVTGQVIDENDNCTPVTNLDAIPSDVIVNHPNCENGDIYTVTRTWTLTDQCGNKTVHDQIIHVKDIIPPTFTKPADQTIFADANCSYNASISITGDVTNESDNCAGVGEATFTDAVDDSNPCHKIISRTWTLTDKCGNTSAPQIQIIHVLDNTKPVFTTCPTGPFYVVINDVINQTYTHSGSSWDALADDNCTDVTYTYTLSGVTNTGPTSGSTLDGVVFNKGETTVMWTASDACGNSQTCIFKVIVHEITITKSGPPNIRPGQNITYTITITNNSPTAIPLVTLNDILPIEIENEVFTHDGSLSAPWTGSYDIPNLAGTNTVVISGKVSCDATTKLTNIASITYAITAEIISNTVETDVINLLSLSAIPDSPDCPGAFNGGVDLTVTGGTAPYSYTWSATDGGVVPPAQQTSQDLTNIPAGTYTVIVIDANLCSKTESFTVVSGADNEIPTFDTKGPFEFCVSNILSAAYDGAPEPAADIIPVPAFSGDYPPSWRRPDWYVVNSNHIASTELDIINLADNCCSDEQLLDNLTWEITFDAGLVPPRSPISGTGQPSTFDPGNDGIVDEIILWGTPSNNEVTHTITYTMKDCNNLSNPAYTVIKTATIVIKPRPIVDKL